MAPPEHGSSNDLVQMYQQMREDSVAYLHTGEVKIIPKYRKLIEISGSQNSFNRRFISIAIVIYENDFVSGKESERSKRFWSYHGKHLRKLHICIPGKYFHLLFEMLPHCPNLESLTVNTNSGGVPQRQFSLNPNFYLRKLRTLTVKGSPFLVFPLFNKLILRANRLENVTFICGAGLTCVNETSFVHNPLSYSLISRLSCLKSITVQCAVDHSFIEKLTGYFGKQLLSLTLANSCNLDAKSLALILDSCPKLDKFILGKWRYDTYAFSHIANSFKSLTSLSFSSTNVIDNETMASLTALHYLARLNISHCPNVSSVGVFKLFGAEVKTLMTELHLVQLSITDRVLKWTLPKLPNLEILDLSHCQRITRKSLRTIAKNNPSLQCLILNFCEGIDLETRHMRLEDSLLCINKMTRLTHFGAMKLSRISRACDLDLKLPRLQVLDYLDFPSDIKSFKQRCPGIKYINNFCCHTKTCVRDPAYTILKKFLNLACGSSPFGHCYDSSIIN